jgi:hypothetical protein
MEDGAALGIGDAGSPVGADVATAAGADGAAPVAGRAEPPAGAALFAGSDGRSGVIGFSARAGASTANSPASNPPANTIVPCRGFMVLPRSNEPLAAVPSPAPRHGARAVRMKGRRLHSTVAPGLGSSPP